MTSIKDVAREAGVSTATVSHVVNNTRFVSKGCGRACSMPSSAAATTRTRTRARSPRAAATTLGLVVSDISNPFFPELIKSIEAAAFERGYDLILSNTDYDPGRTSHDARRFIERKVAGVVVMTSELDKKLLGELASRDVSVVFLDLGKPGIHMSNLSVNYEAGDRRGHRPPRRARPQGDSLCQRPRKTAARPRGGSEAFRNSMRRHLPAARAVRFYRGDFKLEGGRRAAAEMLAPATVRPTAVLAANDLMAFGVMAELRGAGLQIPRDVSIIGFDDIAFASLGRAAARRPVAGRGVDFGRRAVDAYMEKIQNPPAARAEVNIPATHSSTGAPATPPAPGPTRKADRLRSTTRGQAAFGE